MKKVSDMFAKCRFCVGYDQLTTNATVEKSVRIHSFSVKVVLETDVGISLDNPRNVLPDWNISSSVSLSRALWIFIRLRHDKKPLCQFFPFQRSPFLPLLLWITMQDTYHLTKDGWTFIWLVFSSFSFCLRCSIYGYFNVIAYVQC